MPERERSVSITVNGDGVVVSPGTMVAAAVLMTGAAARTSVTGEPRAPLCGMGICFECRVTIDGAAHQRACQILCAEGMCVETAEFAGSQRKA
jgi:D-hydroxyproline dehydrogenase subunit gamma